MSFVDEDFKDAFREWLEYKRERRENYKSAKSLKMCYNHLLELSDNNPQKARCIVEQSIANNYSGLFELKNYGKNRKLDTEPDKSSAGIKSIVFGK